MHTSLGLTLKTQIGQLRIESLKSHLPTLISLHVMNLVLKSDRHTHEMATTHIWFLSPCVGPGGLSGVATSEAGGTGPRAGTQPRPGPPGPGTREEGQWAPGKGPGLAVPAVPPLTHGLRNAFRVWAQHGRRVQLLPNHHSRRVGRSLSSTRVAARQPRGRFPFGIRVAAFRSTRADGQAAWPPRSRAVGTSG